MTQRKARLRLAVLTMDIAAQIISAIAAIIAAIAAWLSYTSAKKNQEISEKLISPHIAVYVQSERVSKNLIDIVVRNDGGGLARDISFNVSGDDLELMYQQPGHEKLSHLQAFDRGIKSLPPRQERKYFILSLVGRYEDVLKRETTVTVNYWNADRSKAYSDDFTLDFASLSESGWTDDNVKAPKNIADELKQIRKILERKK